MERRAGCHGRSISVHTLFCYLKKTAHGKGHFSPIRNGHLIISRYIAHVASLFVDLGSHSDHV